MERSPDVSPPATHCESAEPSAGTSVRAAALLIRAMRELSRARTCEAVAEVVKTTARELVRADGATFVLRDGDQCFYLDEDAISPLWKGQRFPMEACVSGWVMRHGEQAAMPDIYADARVPHAAYRPTFVRSLVMTPVRPNDPIAAIGIYWAEHHEATEHELRLLQDLADTTAVALENVYVYDELERRVAERTEQLTRANVELDAFSHMVAHDLRSPLAAMIGFAELLQDSQPSLSHEKVQTFASAIAHAGHDLNRLIGALLTFAHSSRCELQKERVDLSRLMQRIVAQSHVRAINPHAEVAIAPDLHAYADPSLIEAALTNLMGNALKYSAKRPLARVEFGCAGREEGATTFFVRDDGVGFDVAESERLFQPFQRLHRPSEFSGHGIGLATVAGIVRRHGGRIWADAQPDRGATFYFSLPDPE